MRRSSFLISASLAALASAAPALAQPSAEQAAEPIYLEADTLVDESGSGVYVARGEVRLTSGGRFLLADELIYDRPSGRVTARGSVRLFDGAQLTQSADEMVLPASLEEGVAYGFAAMLERNGKVAAAAALRRPGGRTELRDAYYTACELCDEGRDDPTWRLRAREVVRDPGDEMIRYRDMRIEIEGVPIFYTPYFAHADPDTERQSGFLLPRIDNSGRLGFTYQQPYFWAISPYQDLVISPRFLTEANPLVDFEWVRRFYSGHINVEGSFTYEQDYFDPDSPPDRPDPDADPRWLGDSEFRGYLFADGRFALADRWSWGFGLQNAYDPLYLARYDYDLDKDPPGQLFRTNRIFLSNQVYFVGRGDNYFLDASTLGFSVISRFSDNDQQPLVAPLVRFSGDVPFPKALGEVDFDFNMVNITRQVGDDYARASVGLNWSRPTILPLGVRAEAFSFGRIDAFHYNETNADGANINTETFTRTVGAAGVDLSWPFVRLGSAMDIEVAPRTLLVAASGLDDDRIPVPAEGGSFDLDRSTLFQADRTGGYDFWEDGVRVDAGLEGRLTLDGRFSPHVRGFVGRSYRLDGDEALIPGPSVASDQSDLVFEIAGGVSFASGRAQVRTDAETGQLRRADVSASLDLWRVSLGGTYTEINDQRAFEELLVGATIELTSNISIFHTRMRDIDRQEDRELSAGIVYRDECSEFRVVWGRSTYRIGNLPPQENIRFEFVLFTLGGLGPN
jgi:LPS-assembly protein